MKRDCNFCSTPTPAIYDGKTIFGYWAYMCDMHWSLNGNRQYPPTDLSKVIG